MARSTVTRRDTDPALALGAPLRHPPGQRAAFSQFVPAPRRPARSRSRPAARLLRRAERDDAQTASHPRPKPGPAHRHRTPSQSPRPDRPADRVLKLRRTGPTPDRQRPAAVLGGRYSHARIASRKPRAPRATTAAGRCTKAFTTSATSAESAKHSAELLPTADPPDRIWL